MTGLTPGNVGRSLHVVLARLAALPEARAGDQPIRGFADTVGRWRCHRATPEDG